ncbi:TetR/AcrR family transcriptional regulator [Paenibacillus monticola]|uniref:TetR family transcriptional regulator n=1 Tax=Paenibacillus monticola TaxID=2666075 RepID=A0A7X2H192_9BACL|nr:TetR/AcrR family transcriptional regulator [Paenibacillus monticola]MRN51480.1 TetR family transcriptional regulator [Paenibacillus monticola]
MMEDQKKKYILATALDVFFKYGYKRVSMNDIAEAAGISRAGLYLFFKSKEEVFRSTILLYGDNLIEEITKGLASEKTAEEKMMYVFEVYSIDKFDLALNSPEMREVTDSSYQFAQDALDASYGKLEAVLVALLAEHNNTTDSKMSLPPERMAHIVTCALRGFKIVAKNSAELRQMLQDLLGVVLAV